MQNIFKHPRVCSQQSSRPLPMNSTKKAKRLRGYKDILLAGNCQKICWNKFVIKLVAKKKKKKKRSKIQNQMWNYVEIEINEENCKPFRNWRKVLRLWIITLQFQLKKQSKQNNLLILTISCEKRSCIIKVKK